MRLLKFYALNAILAGSLFAAGEKVVVYHDPNCGCCEYWIKYMQQAGFDMEIHKSTDMLTVKQKQGLTNYDYMSCHTGLAGGYIIEGHVPPEEVQRLLKEKPENVLGISVPDMPLGSYGMDYGPKEERYDVLLLFKDGSSKVYSTYHGKKPINQ